LILPYIKNQSTWMMNKSRLLQMRGAGYEAVLLHRKYPATMQML